MRGKYPFCPLDAHLRQIFLNLCLKTVFFYVFSSKFRINLPKIADQWPVTLFWNLDPKDGIIPPYLPYAHVQLHGG